MPAAVAAVVESTAWRVEAITRGQPALGVRQSGCRGDVLLQVRHEPPDRGLSLGEVVAELAHGVGEEGGLVDGLLGGPDADGRIAALPSPMSCWASASRSSANARRCRA